MLTNEEKITQVGGLLENLWNRIWGFDINHPSAVVYDLRDCAFDQEIATSLQEYEKLLHEKIAIASLDK